MLYDPQWETQTDEFTLKNLIAWLEKQPAEKTYQFTEMRQCLLAQWLRSIDDQSHPADIDDNAFTYFCKGGVQNLIEFRHIAADGERTFGAALQRARKSLR